MGAASYRVTVRAMSDTREISRRVHAPAAAIFAVVRDPARHVEFDGSRMLRGLAAGGPIGRVGDTFAMHMRRAGPTDYVTTSVVCRYEPDRELAWRSGNDGEGEPDRVWGYRLRPIDDATTDVTLFADWTDVRSADLRAKTDYFDEARLGTSLAKLAALVEPGAGTA